MNTTQQLLNRAKAHIGAESDYRLAKTLQWNPATVSSYRTGRSQLDSNGLFVLAELLGMSHAETLAALASIEAERAKDEQTRATWQARLKRLGGVAATVTVAAFGIGASDPAYAAQQPGSDCASQSATSYCFQKRTPMHWRRNRVFAALLRLIFQQLEALHHSAPHPTP